MHQAPIVYVHSKVSIFDTDTAIVSSANLNGRSLRWDTEAGVQLNNPEHVTKLRDRLYSHWMPEDVMAQRDDPRALYDAWRDTVMSDTRRAPADRRSLLLPYDLEAAKEVGEAIPYVPRELV